MYVMSLLTEMFLILEIFSNDNCWRYIFLQTDAT